MHLNNLKIIAAAVELKVSSLRVYVANDYFPIVKLGNRVFVTNETLENLKWMKEQGMPLSHYYYVDGKPFKDALQPQKEPREIWKLNREGKLTNQGSSGLGDNGSDSTTDFYDVPKELILWGEDQTTMSIPNLRKKVKSLLDELQLYEEALREKDKGYTGRTIVASAPGLVDELQQTIAEQELTIEKLEKTEYRQNVNMVKQLEKYDTLIQDFNKLNKQWETKYEQLKKKVGERASEILNKVKQANATLTANKEYTKEEDARLKQMLDDIIKGQNKPR